jgi:hypothetical protein
MSSSVIITTFLAPVAAILFNISLQPWVPLSLTSAYSLLTQSLKKKIFNLISPESSNALILLIAFLPISISSFSQDPETSK